MLLLIAGGCGQSITNSEDSMETGLRPATNVVSEFTVVPMPSEETDKSEENEQNYPTPTAKGLVATIPLRELSGDIVPNDESLEAISLFTITSALCDDEQGPDCSKLRLGDDYLTTSMPGKGYLYSCNEKNPNAPGATANNITWINLADKTWNLFKKLWLPDGNFSPVIGTYTEWLSDGDRSISINNLPVDGKIGDWPMTSYPILTEIDRNPGTPSPHSSSFSYAVSPLTTMSPTCVSLGAIGVTKNGVVIYNAADARGEDALAREIVDVFGGHPAMTYYHYHFIPERLDNEPLYGGHSGIVGYINDGFPIYGYKGEGGTEMSNDDLDICHGHKHGTLGYHYHATLEYPYTVGCYMGTPLASLIGSGNLDHAGQLQNIGIRSIGQGSDSIGDKETFKGKPDCLPPDPPPGMDNYPPGWLHLNPCP